VVSIASYKVIFVLAIFVVDIPFILRISIQEVASSYVLVIPRFHLKLLSQYVTCIINDRRMTK